MKVQQENRSFRTSEWGNYLWECGLSTENEDMEEKSQKIKIRETITNQPSWSTEVGGHVRAGWKSKNWDAWLPDWRCEGAADGDTHESCHLRELRPLCSSALGCPVQAPQCGLGCEWLAEPAVEMLSRGEQGQGGAPGVFLSPCQADSLPRAIVSASLQPSDLCTGSSFGCKGVSWKSSSQPYQAGVSQFRTLSTWKTHTQLTKNKNMHSNILVCESSPVVSWKFLQSLKTFQLLWNTSMSIASTSWSIWRYFPL